MAPIRPLYEVGRATAQLLVLPAEQYKKDKRLLKGLRKGELRGCASAHLPFVVFSRLVRVAGFSKVWTVWLQGVTR